MKKSFLWLVLLLGTTQVSLSQTVAGLEYWFDANYTLVQSKTVGGGSVAHITDEFDVSALSTGMHVLSVRFRDNNARWSPVSDYVFFKAGASGQSQQTVDLIEYWFDYTLATKLSQTVSGSQSITTSLAVPSISNGPHVMSVRFKDNNGLWSPVSDYVVFKAEATSGDAFLITGYRYWYETDSQNMRTVDLPTPAPTAMVYQLLNLTTPSPDVFPQLFSIQFRDNAGVWSSVYVKKFVPEPSFTSYKYLNTFAFQNTSSFSRSFRWNFGDGTSDTVVNPKHTYRLPGVYTVTLTATNSLGTRDTFDVVDVRGLREVVSNKAGNTGDASILIYGGGFTKDAKVWLEGATTINADTAYIERMDAVFARFDLRSKPVGVYDVMVQFPGDEAMTLTKAFTIEQGTVAQPYVSLNGRDRILFGRWQSYQLTVGNKGNVDASGVPLILVVSKANSLELDFGNLRILQTPETMEKGLSYLLDSVPVRYDIDELFGEPFNGSVYMFYIPSIPANTSRSLEIRFRTMETFRALAWLNSPYFQSPFDDAVASCINETIAWYVAEKGLDLGLKFIPGAGCIKNLGKEAYGTYSRVRDRKIGKDADGKPYKGWGDWAWGWGNWVADMTAIGVGCALDVFPPTKAAKFAYATAKTLIELNKIKKDVRKLAAADKKCREKFQHLSGSDQKIRAVSSFDPNEIVGPSGYTSKNYTHNQSPFSYRIYFENKASATAAAQEVVVIDTLDPRVYDLSTFSFGAFSVSGKLNNPLSALHHFTVDIDSIRNRAELLRVNGLLDTVTGIVRWQFMTLNPATMDYPEDPDAGFLPPNGTSPMGEGYVSYSVRLKSGVSEGTVIANRAMITFDLNAPIFTNTHSNMLDLSVPSSRLTGIYHTLTPNYYRFSYTASDALSGVRYVTLYGSRNDSAFIPLMTSNQNPFYYQCDAGVRYRFYCVATDSVGNQEVEKSTAELSTDLVEIRDETSATLNPELTINPIPAADQIEAEFKVVNDGTIEVQILDLYGRIYSNETRELTQTGSARLSINTTSLTDGVYLLRCRTRGNTLSSRFVIVR